MFRSVCVCVREHFKIYIYSNIFTLLRKTEHFNRGVRSRSGGVADMEGIGGGGGRKDHVF